MNKFIKSVISVIILISMFDGMCNASFIDDISQIAYSGSERISFKWIGKDVTNAFEPGNVTFELTSFVKAKKDTEYTVFVSIDGSEERQIKTLHIEPSKEHKDVINIPGVKSGYSDLIINVKEENRIVFTHQEKIAVIEGYTKQFMDEYSWYGANANYRDGSDYHVQLGKKALLEYFTKSGLNALRHSPYWNGTDIGNGTYLLPADRDQWIEKFIRDNGYKNINGLAYGNPTKYPHLEEHIGNLPTVNDVTIGVATQEAMYAKAEAIKHQLSRDGITADIIEVWNEPNITSVWKPAPNKTDYANMLKAITTTLRSEYKNQNVAGFSFADINMREWTEDLYGTYGVYPYMNDVAYHFYMPTVGIDDNDAYFKKMRGYEESTVKYGGWKKHYVTEAGFPTHQGNNGATEEHAAENFPKLYTIGDKVGHRLNIYSFRDNGTDIKYAEDNFGILRFDFSFKLPFFSITQHNIQLRGGIYIGELDLEDKAIRAFVYLKEQKPVVIIWDSSNERESVELTFTGEHMKINDMNGTLISSNTDTITVTKNPSYINGLSHKYISMAAKAEVAEHRDYWMESYKLELPEHIVSKAETVFENVMNSFDNPDENKIYTAADEVNKLGISIIESFSKGEISDLTASKTTYGLSKIAEIVCHAYMSEYSGEVLYEPLYTTDEMQRKADRLYREDNRMMQYSDGILNFAVEVEKDAKSLAVNTEYDKEITKGYIAGWSLLTKIYCEWFDYFSDNEKILNYGLLINTKTSGRSAYLNENAKVKIYANNREKLPFEGYIKMYDEEDNEIASSEILEIKPEEFKYLEFPFKAQKYNESRERQLKVSFVDINGNRLTNDTILFSVLDQVSVFVKPSTKLLEDLDQITLQITNLTSEDVDFKLNVQSDENYEFAASVFSVSLKGSEVKDVNIPVKFIKNVPYHFYTVEYSLTNSEGTEVLKDKDPVNFTAVVNTNDSIIAEDFNGDISDWSDAYPIYINSPQSHDTKEAWQNADAAARAFMKWDSEHVYVLVDAYDDKHYNDLQGESLWNGDCVQMSFDTLNDDSVGEMAADDYEFGASLGFSGVHKWCWYAAMPNKIGQPDIDVNVVRSDEYKCTRYLLVFEKEALQPLDISDGNVFGFNLLHADGDVLTRDDYFEFTSGTSAKNPSAYADFRFVIEHEKKPFEGNDIASSVFPQKFN